MRGKRGFTLVELMVVIAILGILAGVASFSINRLLGTQARKFINEYDAMLSRCRVDTLAGAEAPCYLKLYRDGGDYRAALYEGGTEKAAETLGGSNMQCGYLADGVACDVDTAPLCLSFDRATGAFLKLEEVRDAGGSSLNSVSGRCTEIQVSCGASSFRLSLVPTTGYHKVD